MLPTMFQDTVNLAAMADALNLSPDFRVLRRLVPRIPYAPSIGQEVRTGILLDTEIHRPRSPQGRDHRVRHGQIRLRPRRPHRRRAGCLLRLQRAVGADPGGSDENNRITDEMVAGHRLADAAVAAFAEDSVIAIAHNSSFDRKFVERNWPVSSTRRGPAA